MLTLRRQVFFQAVMEGSNMDAAWVQHECNGGVIVVVKRSMTHDRHAQKEGCLKY